MDLKRDGIRGLLVSSKYCSFVEVIEIRCRELAEGGISFDRVVDYYRLK